MEEYESIMKAIDILSKSRQPLSMDSPAWTMLTHAKWYLQKQADKVMRGE